MDVQRMIDAVHDHVRRYIDPALDAIGQRFAATDSIIESLSSRLAAMPAEGPRGEKGDAGEKGSDGRNGADGKSVTVDEIQPILEQLVGRIPIPVDGVDGAAGRDGTDGKPGRDGTDGKDGRGVTAEDFRPLFEAEHAKWALEFERRSVDMVQRFLEKVPKPLDGKDGLGFDDLEVTHDGERAVTLKFTRGESVKEFTFVIPTLIERGVYKPDTTYQSGDGVTYGGSFWIAQKETTDKPGEGASWRLAVKKGRDGKDGAKP